MQGDEFPYNLVSCDFSALDMWLVEIEVCHQYKIPAFENIQKYVKYVKFVYW